MDKTLKEQNKKGSARNEIVLWLTGGSIFMMVYSFSWYLVV